jgi:hypothetical protein
MQFVQCHESTRRFLVGKPAARSRLWIKSVVWFTKSCMPHLVMSQVLTGSVPGRHHPGQ